MKAFFKQILRKVGLLSWLQRFLTERGFQQRYGHVNQYTLVLSNHLVLFSTKDDYSKQWFFPRYDNGKVHEPVVTGLFEQHIQQTDCVLDIGAHLGYFTCLASALCTKGEVHAFEMEPLCIPLITENIKLNQLNNVVLNHAAVVEKSGLAYIPRLSKPKSSLKLTTLMNNAQEIPAISIDTYIENKQIVPSFIKIDVEGAEWKVLKGMKHTLSKPNLKLLIEIHVIPLRDHFQTDYRDILQYLRSFGYTLIEYPDHRVANSLFRVITEETILEGNTIIYCVK